ncbi:RND superfamily putative drug exporter [Solirubrobacter pauli]|uniref:RND superfamily putative drug exporter n=1 Tax=Solirubrobacter pauli TaxID=166793 RepID=A0A660LAT2_9ACTN|nr:efflux RND transporter permease subunit [Solirubrobacter pauli]RKQ92122.1 RND superfamily putative drug exporter [Solirubrobacter pauli]
MLGRWGRVATRWRLPVVGVWIVLALVGGIVGGGVFDRTKTVEDLRSSAESKRAEARVDALDPEGETVVAVIGGADFYTPALVQSATNVFNSLRQTPGVVDVSDAYTSGGLVAVDGNSSVAVVELDPRLSEERALALADDVSAKIRTIDAPEVYVGGELLAERTFADRAVDDAVFGESIALVVLCVVLILFLGGMVAGLLPLAAALATIATALLALNALAGSLDVSEFAVNVVTLLGLGLAVDYSLLVIARFRQERADAPDDPLEDVLERTVAAAGRAVLVSGLAVAIALAGLAVFGTPVLAAMALGGLLAVCLATIAGLTLVPALIALAHRRIPAPGTRTWVWRRPRGERRGLLETLAAFSQRHRVPVALVSAVALLALTFPVTGLDVNNSDASALPESTEERVVAERLERDFPLASVPVTVVVEADSSDPKVQGLMRFLFSQGKRNDVNIAGNPTPGVTRVEIAPQGTSAGPRAQQIVRDVRAYDAPVPVLVGGPAAELIDAKESTRARLPLALLVIFVPTALLLFALTRSVLIPIKALLLNLLTLGATLGALVLIFPDPLDITTPLLLFMFIFGLSMDYEVFLLARIKEEWDRTRDNDRAVLTGIAASGPVVTAAAISIGIVFLGFALGELVQVKQVGVGMAIAVFLDVTVVRGLLLPATMSLLGRLNWWPGVLTRKTGQMV